MDPRRTSPRIDVEALCWELIGEREVSSFVVDLSSDGARLERPFTGGRIAREVPLQLEIPGIDEVMWARGDVVFDQIVAAPDKGPFGLMRRTGFHISLAAARDLRLVRDYVYSMYEATYEPENDNDFFAYSLARAYRSR